MENLDELLLKSYWTLREITCYKLLEENSIILKDATSLYLNIIMYYYQEANKTLYTKQEKLEFYDKNIKRYIYTLEVFDKVKPFLKRKTITEFLHFYGKKKFEGKLNTNVLSKVWETLELTLDTLTTEELVKINENNGQR